MTTSRIALVTGANQGLGRALVEGLAAGLSPSDRVLLTGRDPERVAAAARRRRRRRRRRPRRGPRARRARRRRRSPHWPTNSAPSTSSSRTRRHGCSPDADPADEVDAVAETNNLATTRVLRAFAPRLRPGGRLIIVASALGTLDKLADERVAGRFAAAAEEDLDAVDALVAGWRASVLSGRAEARRASARGSTSRRRSVRSPPSGRSPASAVTTDLANGS